eukprot:1759749-Rhodomonas_salina.1
MQRMSTTIFPTTLLQARSRTRLITASDRTCPGSGRLVAMPSSSEDVTWLTITNLPPGARLACSLDSASRTAGNAGWCTVRARIESMRHGT